MKKKIMKAELVLFKNPSCKLRNFENYEFCFNKTNNTFSMGTEYDQTEVFSYSFQHMIKNLSEIPMQFFISPIYHDSSKLSALRSQVPHVSCALRTLVPHVPRVLRASVYHVPRTLRVSLSHMPLAFCALILTYIVSSVPSCLTCNVLYLPLCLTCSCVLRAPLALCLACFMCQSQLQTQASRAVLSGCFFSFHKRV